CARLLPGICTGERLVAVAWDPPFTATPDGRLSGHAHQVLDAADTVLAATGDALYEVEATAVATDSLDLTRPFYEIHLDDVPARRLAGGFSVSALRDVALVALSAEQIGAA